MATEIYARDVSIEGLAGAGALGFEGRVKHGSGKRNVRLHVQPETILRLAAWLLVEGYSVDSYGGQQLRRWHTGAAALRFSRNTKLSELPEAGVFAPKGAAGHRELATRLLAIADGEKET